MAIRIILVDETKIVATGAATLALEVFEDGVPPCFRSARASAGELPAALGGFDRDRSGHDGARQTFAFLDRAGFVESRDEIPEPHEFVAHLRVGVR